MDTLASTEAETLTGAKTSSTNEVGILAAKSYNSPGFTYGVYIGGTKPTVFSLNSIGYAQFSSVYQNNVNPGESVSISYQTLDANSGSVLAGKSLSGIHSTAKVDLTTKVQKNTAVNAYLYNFAGNLTAASGNFNY